MKWSAMSLKQGYKRSIVGFDVRVSSSLNQQNRSEIPYHGDWYDQPGIRFTCDIFVWPSFVDYQSPGGNFNGLNMLSEAPSHVNGYGGNQNKTIVAFDIPDALGNAYKARFGLILSPLETVSTSQDFEFCGYDVVGMTFFSSAFYSFDWEKKEIEETLRSLAISLNRYGLVENETKAIEASKYFERTIPEHTPFAPCGVWKKNILAHPTLG